MGDRRTARGWCRGGHTGNSSAGDTARVERWRLVAAIIATAAAAITVTIATAADDGNGRSRPAHPWLALSRRRLLGLGLSTTADGSGDRGGCSSC